MNYFELTFQDILWSLKKYLAWILLVTALAVAGTWVYTTQFVQPTYRATLSMCVFATERNGSTVTSGELSNDARLANTYRLLLTSQPVMDAVSEYLGGSKSSVALSGMVSASVVSDSQLIRVYVVSTSPQDALAVADAISEVAPTALRELARGGEMVAVDRAQLPTAPISPKLGANLGTAAFWSLLISCGIVILLSKLDTTIWREEDLTRAFDIPVLGSVPGIDSAAQAESRNRRK